MGPLPGRGSSGLVSGGKVAGENIFASKGHATSNARVSREDVRVIVLVTGQRRPCLERFGALRTCMHRGCGLGCGQREGAPPFCIKTGTSATLE